MIEQGTFYILDVFAEKRFSGNQLAVVIDGPDFTDEDRVAIAREFNFSETTFFAPSKDDEGAYPTRIFTPSGEIPFAGHPVLGTAHVIRKCLEIKDSAEVRLNLPAGAVPVTQGSLLSGPPVHIMKQPEPSFGRTIEHEVLAKVLGLRTEDLDNELPVEIVSTGLPFYIVPVLKLKSVASIVLDMTGYYDLVNNSAAKAIYAFSADTYVGENHFNARMFAPALGIDEDPATGSAAGCLAAYLSKYRRSTEPLTARIEQGYEIGRRSLIQIKAEKEGNSISVEVGGKVFDVAMGKLR